MRSFEGLASGVDMFDPSGMFDVVSAISEFVRYPSVSADPEAKEAVAEAARYLAELLRKYCGCAVELVPTKKHPVVIARRGGDASWPHVVIYGHYDVQPADPVGLWETKKPFEPFVRGDKMFGRGAADDKGPMMVHVAALANLLERRPDLPLRVTFMIEGEEEIGSPNLASVMMAYRESLSGDFLLMSDTTCDGLDDPCITAGLRGLAALEVRLKGPSQDLHSGLFGGPVMNPIRALTALCASLFDADGRVNVPGFYDGVKEPESWELAELERRGLNEATFMAQAGVSAFSPMKGAGVFESLFFWPTLEFNGISGGYEGPGGKTIIPSTASVKISCRIVPGQDAERILGLLEIALRERCPAGIEISFERQGTGDACIIVPPHLAGKEDDTPLARAFAAADRASQVVFGKSPHYIREGASIPILPAIKNILGMDALMLGVALPDCRMHSPNENLDLRMIERCTKVSEAILEAVAG